MYIYISLLLGFVFGWLLCALMTMGKVADLENRLGRYECPYDEMS